MPTATGPSRFSELSRFATLARTCAIVILAASAVHPSVAQTGPATVAFVWANDAASASYTPSTAYAYNPAGGITINRAGTGLYEVVFAGLGTLTDGQVGGIGNVQVSAYGTTAAICKAVSFGAQTNYSVNVRCYNSDGVLADGRYTVLVTLPGSNPVDLGFVYANLEATASYTADKSWAYSSEDRDVTITRSSAGNYVATFEGLGGAFTASGASLGGHMQATAIGSDNASCQIIGWGNVSGDLSVNVRCFSSSGSSVDSEFSLLAIGKDTDMGGLGFAWADNASSASYTPNTTYSFNESTNGIGITRSSTGVYQVTWTGLSVFGDGSAGGSGHVQVVAYGSSFQPYCMVGGWSGVTAEIRCFTAFGEFHTPVDTQFDVLFLYRQTTATQSGTVDFDAYADGQTITSVVGEPVTFPNGLDIVGCSKSSTGCLRAWSGNRVATGQVIFEFDREPIVMEFSSPQSTVAAHVNGYAQSGESLTLTLTAKRANGTVIGSTVEVFNEAPAWGTRLEYTQPPGSPIIARVEIAAASNFDWFFMDDLYYDDDTVLPVELASFDAILDGRDIVFRWESLSEVGTSGYRVEQELRQGWAPLSTLISATSPAGGMYSWRHANAAPLSGRFRLASIDLDGSVDYSEIVEIASDVIQQNVVGHVYPNPFSESASLDVVVRDAQRVTVEVFDMLGRSRLVVADGAVTAGQRLSLRIEADHLAAGTYLVRIHGDHFLETRPFVVAR